MKNLPLFIQLYAFLGPFPVVFILFERKRKHFYKKMYGSTATVHSDHSYQPERTSRLFDMHLLYPIISEAIVWWQ